MIEKTLVLVKPDGVVRGLIGEIIKRFEQRGLKLVGLKMIKPTKELAEKHYPDSEQQISGMGAKTLQAGDKETIRKLFKTEEPKEIGKVLRNWLVQFITSEPVVAMVVEGYKAISAVRKICGFTDPAKAELGTIRGDFGHTGIEGWNAKKSAVKNLVHASGSADEAENEIKLWFTEKEIYDYKLGHESNIR